MPKYQVGDKFKSGNNLLTMEILAIGIINEDKGFDEGYCYFSQIFYRGKRDFCTKYDGYYLIDREWERIDTDESNNL
jgi:uncharacterized membrane protein